MLQHYQLEQQCFIVKVPVLPDFDVGKVTVEVELAVAVVVVVAADNALPLFPTG